jgi:hypothetical protein
MICCGTPYPPKLLEPISLINPLSHIYPIGSVFLKKPKTGVHNAEWINVSSVVGDW